MLVEEPLVPSDRPLSQTARAFVAEGRARFRSVDCFDFVPSDYEMFWRVLDALPRGRFCEWGSGFGIATGLAEMLGYDTCGIELDTALAAASRALRAQFGLRAPIETGDYFAGSHQADVYFVYCWPGKALQTEAHFERVAPGGARLLICHGQSDIRCKVRADAET
jgi:hypothetical protein